MDRQADDRGRAGDPFLSCGEDCARFAVDVAGLRLFVYWPSTGEIACNARMAEIWEDAAGGRAEAATILERIHPEDREAVRRAGREAMAGEDGRERRVEFRQVLADGSFRWHSVAMKAAHEAEVDGAGRTVRVLGVDTDVTGRHEAEDALRIAEERWAMALQATREGVWDWNLETGDCFYSERWKSMLGYSGPEIEPHVSAWLRLLHPDDAALAEQVVEGVRRGDREYVMEFRMRHRDGHYVPLLSRGYPIRRTPDGPVFRIVGTHLDLTEQKRADEALRQAKDDAEAASRAKTEFLANMSHEIRTPMASILGYCELLEKPGLPEETRNRYLAVLQRSGQTLLHLLDDVLDLSRIEAGRLRTEKLDCLPEAVVDEVVSILREQAGKKGLALEVERRGTLPEVVRTDPTRLRQILLNLIGNAVKFTEKGRVRVVLSCDPGSPGRLSFAVEDTGIGIEPGLVERIFEPFVQGDTSHTRRFGGSGLGLAISRRLAGLLGGTLDVESTPGEGSRFTLALEVDAAAGSGRAPSEGEDRPESDAVPLDGGRVLVVEDSEAVRELLVEQLSEAGLEVENCSDGEQACRAVSAADHAGRPYDVVFMDVQMPAMDGLTATRWLRSRRYTGPIVALTAHAMVGDRERCLEAGCNGYLTKPVSARDLLAAVARHTPGRASGVRQDD